MTVEGYADAKRVPTLDVTSVPKGSRANLLIELAHDGLGTPICVPVLVARGRRDGPVFGITAAIHGNEINGIPVIHRLFEHLDTRQLRGTVVAVPAVNIPGILGHRRTFSDGRDLNHLMAGRPVGNDAELYAHRLIERVIRPMDRLLDLHTASFGRVNSLYVRADMTHAATAEMAYLQRPQIIVHNPPSDGTLRGTAAALGIPAITVEIGDPQRFQPSFIKHTVTGIRRLLAAAQMLPRRTKALPSETVICGRSYWMYSDRGGLLDVVPSLTDHVKAGEVVAQLKDIFGNVVREYRAPEAGVVVGRSVNPVGMSGARILHLGVVVDPAGAGYVAHPGPVVGPPVLPDEPSTKQGGAA